MENLFLKDLFIWQSLHRVQLCNGSLKNRKLNISTLHQIDRWKEAENYIFNKYPLLKKRKKFLNESLELFYVCYTIKN